MASVVKTESGLTREGQSFCLLGQPRAPPPTVTEGSGMTSKARIVRMAEGTQGHKESKEGGVCSTDEQA